MVIMFRSGFPHTSDYYFGTVISPRLLKSGDQILLSIKDLLQLILRILLFNVWIWPW